MQLTPRSRPHFVQTPLGLNLLATSSQWSGQAQFPPQAFEMENDDIKDVLLGPLGQIYSYTIVSAGKDVAPYALAMVDFEPGVRVFGPLILQQDRPAIGAQVRVVPHVLADGTPDYAFQMTGVDRGEAA